MLTKVNRVVFGTALAAGLLSFSAATADEHGDERPGLDRWLPSFALQSGVTLIPVKATVDSECLDPGTGMPTLCNPDDPTSASPLREPGRGDDRSVTPYVGGVLSLATPAADLPGRPRLFIAADLPYHFAVERNVAQRNRPTALREPELGGQEDLPEITLLGNGSRTQSQVEGLVFGGGVGAAFSFRFWGREMRIKPSVNYLRFEVAIKGRVTSGRCLINDDVRPSRSICDLDGLLPPDPDDPPDGTLDAFTRAINLSDENSEWFDAVGPGLELEMDTGRMGPLRVSLFAGIAGYYVMGNRSIEADATATFGPDLLGEATTYNANWSTRVSPWMYRAGVGMRFSYDGN